MKERKWSLRWDGQSLDVQACATALALKMGMSRPMAKLLCLRGCTDEEKVKNFLEQGNAIFHDPFLMSDMEKAVERLEKALANKEKICIYGDYDVDGVTSTTVLLQYLQSRGGNVTFFIPDRITHGYGMSVCALDEVIATGAHLIVTVDNGITSLSEVAYAYEKGLEVIVTDHHECLSGLPVCEAVVDPHRKDDSYPFKELAGVGVVFKLVTAMEARRSDFATALKKICNEYIDLVCLGTVADVMTLTNENRLIVSLGLDKMEKAPRLGVDALMKASLPNNQGKRKINATTIGFTLAPRLNAAGRVANASVSVRLLSCRDREEAQELAVNLCDLNTLRQTIENRIMEQAKDQIAFTMEKGDRFILLESNHWQHGIIGIVASRITEKTGLPSILVSYEGTMGENASPDDLGKGSGRSVPGLNLVHALAEQADLLERFGGHELAAGLSVKRENVPALRRRLNEYANAHLSEGWTEPTVWAEMELDTEDLTLDFGEELEELEPFGTGNPIPNFYIGNMILRGIFSLSGGKHTKLMLEKGGVLFTALWFGQDPSALPLEEGDTVDVITQVSINEYRGNRSLQLMLQDVRYSNMRFKNEEAKLQEVLSGKRYMEKPTREDFGRLYTCMKHTAGTDKKAFFSLEKLLEEVNEEYGAGMSYEKMKLCLLVLAEKKLISYTPCNSEHWQVCLPSVSEKVNLMDSEILKRI